MRALHALARALVVWAAISAVLYWVEAEKEARILCGQSKSGTAAAEVDRLFGTANLLHVRSVRAATQRTLHVSSARNLGLSGCTVSIDRGVVTNWSYVERFRSGAWATVVLLIGLAGLAVRHVRDAITAIPAPSAQPESPRALDARRRVASEVTLAVVVTLGAASVAQLMGLVHLPVGASFAELVLVVVVLTFVVDFILAPPRAGTLARRVALRLVPLTLACCGFVVLFGG